MSAENQHRSEANWTPWKTDSQKKAIKAPHISYFNTSD